jgi:hypothetical protein
VDDIAVEEDADEITGTPPQETRPRETEPAESTVPLVEAADSEERSANAVPGPAIPLTAGDSEKLARLLEGRSDVVEISDDFSSENWPVSASGPSVYRYFGAAYELNNLAAETMAISYQQESLSDFSLSVDSEYLDGAGYVGYGIAGRFRVGERGVSYYGAFISQSGELLILKVVDGVEMVLYDWANSPLINAARANRIELVLIGESISVYINGELAANVVDGDIRSGGYSVMAGPGVSARFDNLRIRGLREG